MKKTLVVFAMAAAMMSGSVSAELMQDFIIDESSVPGTTGFTIEGDKLNGSYNEIYTITASGSGLSFVTEAYADFSAVLANEGANLQPNSIGFGTDDYLMYALFDATGTVTDVGGTAQFNGTSGSFELYIDPDSDTTKVLPGDANSEVILGNTTDDYLIASSTTLTSLENVIGNPGAFDLWFDDFTLTSTDQVASAAGVQSGETYFTDPSPFYLVTNVDGDFDNISFAGIQSDIQATGSSTTTTTGDVSAIFPVPVPATLALMGLGLLGLGGALGRRKMV